MSCGRIIIEVPGLGRRAEFSKKCGSISIKNRSRSTEASQLPIALQLLLPAADVGGKGAAAMKPSRTWWRCADAPPVQASPDHTASLTDRRNTPGQRNIRGEVCLQPAEAAQVTGT